MRKGLFVLFTAAVIIVLLGPASKLNPATINHYEYVFVPGLVNVYDMDNNFALVKSVPLSQTQGLSATRIRGAVANAAAGMLYISYDTGAICCGTGHLIKYNLATDQVVWDVGPYSSIGTDSHSISLDGQKIYMPDGESTSNGIWEIIDANTGSIIGQINSGGTGPHNTITNLSGTRVYMGPRFSSNLVVANAATGAVIQNIGPTGNGTVRPFTIDSGEIYAYITDSNKVGFYVGSIATGKLLYWVCPPNYCSTGSVGGQSGISHGISLSPDQKEIYLIDWFNNYVHVFDVTGLPSTAPVDVKDIKLTCGSAGKMTDEGWLQHSRDGRFVFVGDCGDVIDTATRQVVANIPALVNTRIFQEVDFQNGVPYFSPLSRNQGGYGAQSSNVALSSASLSFGSQTIGTTSSAQTVTLTNNGSSALSITSIAVSGADSSDFAETNTCGSSVAAGANCTISVTFTPTATGARTAAVTITDSDPSSPQTVSLTGTGATAGTPGASVSPTSLTFGSQTVGTTSAAQPVTLTNTGSATLTITSISASGDFAQTDNCGSSLAAGGNCTINVTFKPSATGTRTGTLSVSDNASGSPQTVSLTGTGSSSNTGDFALSASPTSMAVTAGQSASFTLSVTPSGGFNQAVSLSCSGAPQAATCTVTPSSVIPRGTGASMATVTVTTTAHGTVGPWPGPRWILPSFSKRIESTRSLWLLVLLALLASLIAGRRRQVRLVLGFTILIVLLGAGCVGLTKNSGGTTGTPPGNYSLTVTGTSGTGSAQLIHSTTLTFIVN